MLSNPVPSADPIYPRAVDGGRCILLFAGEPGAITSKVASCKEPGSIESNIVGYYGNGNVRLFLSYTVVCRTGSKSICPQVPRNVPDMSKSGTGILR